MIDSPTYHDIITNGLGSDDHGVNERRPPFL